MSPELLTRLDALASKIGTTADRMWSVLIAQARIEAIQDAGFSALFAIFAITCSVTAWRSYKSKSYDMEVPLAVSIMGVFLFVSLAALMACASTTEALNPQYWALKQIIGAAK